MEIYQKFGKYDQDMDGMISPEEAHTILHKEFGFDKERSMAMVKRFDKNKDGLVSYIEFAEFYMAVEERFVFGRIDFLGNANLPLIYYTQIRCVLVIIYRQFCCLSRIVYILQCF